MGKKQLIEDMANEFYPTANEGSKELIDEYLDNSTHLSKKSTEQYKSALRIFVAYLNKHCGNKHITEVKPLDFVKYQNWLLKQGLLSSAIKIKRSAVSNINNHIILFHGDEYPTFRNYITKAIKVPETAKMFEKVPITDEEYEILCNYLEKEEKFQKLAYIKFTYVTGCRKNEARQLLKDCLDSEPITKTIKVKDENGVEAIVPVIKYKSNPIKCKGRATDSARKLSFDEDTHDYIKKWLEQRGEDDCPYVFVTNMNGKNQQVAENTFNQWCDEFSKVLDRRIHPHLFRGSRATSLYLQGKSMDSIRQLLGHKSIETTKIYITKDDEDEEDEIFV